MTVTSWLRSIVEKVLRLFGRSTLPTKASAPLLTKSELASANKIPDRMLMGTRGPDPIFAPDESLFQRCLKMHLDREGRLSPPGLPSPAYSVNREKFGPAEDVLIPLEQYGEYGISTYRVRDIPTPILNEGIEYSFVVLHLPLAENYHHSEVQTHTGGVEIERKAPKEVRKHFRTVIARNCTLLKAPSI